MCQVIIAQHTVCDATCFLPCHSAVLTARDACLMAIFPAGNNIDLKFEAQNNNCPLQHTF